MPRFFFNIYDSAGIIPDTEGMEFLDVDAAKREGEESARELLASDIRARRAINVQRVEVTTEDGTAIASFLFRDLLH